MELEYIHSLCKKTSFFSLRLPGYTSQTGLSEKSSFTTVNYGFYDFASLKNEAFFIRDRLFLQVLHTSEGRIRVSDDSYTFDYLKDHLGNTRVVVSDDGTVQQASNYYPFGMRWNNANTINNQTTDYLYNGKEIQEELGWYDYGARMYDPALGRFMTVDPLTEWHFSATPFHYCFNNPLKYMDFFGLDTLPVNDDGLPDGGLLPEATVTAETSSSSVNNFSFILWLQMLDNSLIGKSYDGPVSANTEDDYLTRNFDQDVVDNMINSFAWPIFPMPTVETDESYEGNSDEEIGEEYTGTIKEKRTANGSRSAKLMYKTTTTALLKNGKMQSMTYERYNNDSVMKKLYTVGEKDTFYISGIR